MAVDLDPVFRQALKLLHSSSSDSAEGIRKYLDELIRQKHGSSRMLVHTLHKKHLAEECRALGSGGNQAKVRRRRSSDKSSVSSDSSASESVRAGQASSVDPIAAESHQSPALANVDDNAIDANIHNALFDDLVCAICRGIDVSAKNRLIECTKCNTLYHQECHSPQIKDAELLNGQELLWHCSDCRTKSKKSLLHSQTIASPHKSNQSPSSSSSNSSTSSISNIISTLSSGSSKRDRDRPKDGDRERESSSGHHSRDDRRKSSKSSSSSSKHHGSSHHSSSSHKHDKSSGSSKSSSNSGSSSSNGNGSAAKIVMPTIQVISADKRLHGSKKKGTKSPPDSKRKK